MPPAASSPAKEDDIINISALLGTLWRGKIIILCAMLITIIAGGYYAYRVATPMYNATAVVMLESREDRVVNLDSVVGALSRDNAVVNSEVEVLQSRSLLGKVVDRLDLTTDPEFNSSLRAPSFKQQIKGFMRNALNSLQPVETQPATLAAPSNEDERNARIHASTVGRLLSALTVTNVSQSLVFEVRITSEDPKKSALIADTLAELYIRNQLEAKFEATEQATSWLTNRVSELQGELERSEARVRDFNSNTDLINQETLAGLERQVKETRDRLELTRATRDAAESRLKTLQAAQTAAEKAAASMDEQLQGMLSQLDDPMVARAFNTRYNQQLARAELEFQRADSQATALGTSTKELSSQITRQSADLITLQQLTREADASRMLYEYFLARLKETSAQQGIQQADSRMLSNAVIPGAPSEPRKSFIVVLSAIFGMLIGSGIVLLLEGRKNTYRTAQELESNTGYPVLGQIPLLPARRRKETIAYLKSRPTSAAAEAIRNLRTSVLLSNVDQQPQVLLTSSSLPGEGKTTVALALAQNMAMMGKKVLLIEGDIRRRVFGQYLGTDKKEGMIAVLMGEIALKDAVLHDPVIGAEILIAEKSDANAADIFSSERFAAMMATARAEYDFVIIDTPPVLIVPDARIIAQHADVTIFVVKWDQTTPEQVNDALHMFDSVNHPVSGLALNQINPRGMKRYGYYQYGTYARYGKRYYTN